MSISEKRIKIRAIISEHITKKQADTISHFFIISSDENDSKTNGNAYRKSGNQFRDIIDQQVRLLLFILYQGQRRVTCEKVR